MCTLHLKKLLALYIAVEQLFPLGQHSLKCTKPAFLRTTQVVPKETTGGWSCWWLEDVLLLLPFTAILCSVSSAHRTASPDRGRADSYLPQVRY